MQEATNTEIMNAVDALEDKLPALELKSDKAAQLATYFKVADAQIAILSKDYLALTCNPEDKKAFDMVHVARMNVKDLRVQVDKTRKGLVADAVEWQRTVNAEAKRITGLLEPIENHLEAQEAIYTAEQDRIKAERQKAVQAKVQERIDSLAAVGVTAALAEIALMSDEGFASYLALAKESFDKAEAIKAQETAEKARKEKEEAERLAKIQAEQAAERKRLETVAAEQAKQAAALKAQQDAIEAQQKAIAQAARDEEIKKEAAAKATAEAERKAKEEAERKEQAEKAKIAEQERQAKAQAEAKAAEEAKAAAIAAARPDAEKLVEFAYFLEGKAPPEMVTPAGQIAAKEIKDLMLKLTTYIRNTATNLTK